MYFSKSFWLFCVILFGFCWVFGNFFADILPKQSEKFWNCLIILLLTYLAPEFRRLKYLSWQSNKEDVDKEDVATPSKLKQCKHLESIVGKISQKEDITVGLLIRANCLKALEPIDIKPSKNDEPYVFKACVCYLWSNFYFFTKWQLFQNSKKCFLFYRKSSFCFQDIQIFVIIPTLSTFKRTNGSGTIYIVLRWLHKFADVIFRITQPLCMTSSNLARLNITNKRIFLNCFVTILFPEMCAITRACTGTHTSKFTCAIYRTHKIIVFSFRFAIIIYFL